MSVAEAQRWRLVLIGDPHQLHAVGRGGMFDELCRAGRSHELATIHRFVNEWEQEASLRLRRGDQKVIDAYVAHDLLQPGTIDDHLETIADVWMGHHQHGHTVAVTAQTNAQVDQLNEAIQARRRDAGHLDDRLVAAIAGGETAGPGDVVVTRRNDRSFHTDTGEPVRNREHWHVDRTHRDGRLSVTRADGHGTVTLPADYVQAHVRLGYAATAHGHQGDTVDVSYTLVSTSTTHAGLYVGATRGRSENHLLALTDSPDLAEAQDLCRYVLTADRADVPATVQQRRLASEVAQNPSPATSAATALEAAARALKQAERRAAPFENNIRAASVKAAHAHDLLDGLQRRLDQARPWKRGEIRQQITDAKVSVEDAETRLDDSINAASEVRDQVRQATDDHDLAKSKLTAERMIERFDHIAQNQGGLGLSR